MQTKIIDLGDGVIITTTALVNQDGSVSASMKIDGLKNITQSNLIDMGVSYSHVGGRPKTKPN